MSTAVLGPPTALSRALADALSAHLCGLDAVSLPRDATGVVIVVGADPHDVSVSSAGDEDWRRLTEEPMRLALMALQRSRSVMSGRGGRIVLVTPTIGMVGARHLVPYTTAVEGIRAMAKSAARQWAASNIVVNTVAAPLPLFAPDMRGSAAHLTAAAVPADDDLVQSIVSTLRFLLQTDSRHVVGATMMVDGGALMLP